MRKIVIYLEKVTYQHDVAVLASFLREKGVECSILFKEVEGEEIAKTIKALAPCYLVMPSEFRAHGGTSELLFVLQTARIIKQQTGVPVVVMGRQASIAAEMLLQRFNFIDGIVVGDPEYPILNLAREGEKEKIAGLSYLNGNGRIVQNPVNRQTNLNSLPRPAFDDFFQHKNANKMGFFVPVSRSCIFRCAFCQLGEWNKKIGNKKASAQYYSVEWIIDNLKYLNSKYGPITNFYFTDTNFTLSKEYIRKFIKLYKSELNIPFICATRANLVDEEVAGLLKEGSCSKVNFGMESGNETTRNKLLRKGISDKHIRKCIAALRKNGIRVQAGIIIGLPGDTFSSALDSLAKAVDFGTDILNVSIYQPYYGTQLAYEAVRKGFLESDFMLWNQSKNKQYGECCLNLVDKKKIENLQLLSPLFKFVPNKRLFAFLCLIPKNRLFFTVYHLPRMLRGLKYEINNEAIMFKVVYLISNLTRIILKKERPYNR
jgi:radical SAM superfamily enzyme YgiQ (UPF0313 family)